MLSQQYCSSLVFLSLLNNTCTTRYYGVVCDFFFRESSPKYVFILQKAVLHYPTLVDHVGREVRCDGFGPD